MISEGKSWQEELPKILMLYRASPHPVSRKSPTMLLPHIESNSNTAASALDHVHRSKCNLYQARLKEYHDVKQNATPHNFRVGDILHCANMKQNKLDSKLSSA